MTVWEVAAGIGVGIIALIILAVLHDAMSQAKKKFLEDEVE